MKGSGINIAALFIVVLLQGCASDRGGEASAEYLSPAGWQDVPSTLQHRDFASYATAIRGEVRRFRLSLDVGQAELEINRASPVELLPAATCSRTRGIALLVHGLSDTAFAMHDIAKVLASSCYVARTVLLPGHGTRAGDLLTTRYAHWQNTLDYLIDQAATESNRIILAGFSLGAVLTLNAALQVDSPVDAILAFSPAYYLSSEKLARLAPWLHWAKPWIDRGVADDAMRYEAMPTRGVAETVRAMNALRSQLDRTPQLSIPWLLVQSLDDAVISPERNFAFFEEHAGHLNSVMINFYTRDKPELVLDFHPVYLPGFSDEYRVMGLTHVAPHVSPLNPHYGANGSYVNCGGTGPRNAEQVQHCNTANPLWYGLWSDSAPNGSASAMSTFNPHFDELANLIASFVQKIE